MFPSLQKINSFLEKELLNQVLIILLAVFNFISLFILHAIKNV